MLKAARGTTDILPPDTWKWAYLERLLRKVASRYNFHEIRTPTFEASELFRRTVGEATDIVEKEMYVFKDKSDRDLTLRPEGTAPVARAFVEHGMSGGPLPRKFYYIGSMFRYEKPQAGRFREHTQFGCEVLGSSSPFSDVEVMLLAIDALKELGLTGTRLALNSIGCPSCRKEYKDMLVRYFEERKDRLCGDCVSRLYRNPLRVLDCKNDACKEGVTGAPHMLDYLCPDCKVHWEEMTRALSKSGIAFEVDHSLVRGLDYYTRTVFELKWPPLGAQSTLVGGGRYDGLVEDIDGPPTPGVGFGMGMDRILLAVEKGEKPIPAQRPVSVFCAKGDSPTYDLETEAFLLASQLRDRGISCDFDPLGRSLKSQMKHASRMGARFVMILGEQEVASGCVTVRSMEEGWQKSIARAELEGFLEEVFGRDE